MTELLRSWEDLRTFGLKIQMLGEHDWLAIDTETYGTHPDMPENGLMPWNGARLSGMSVALAGTHRPTIAAYIPIDHRLGVQAHPKGLDFLLDSINMTGARHVFHHAQFDWAILELFTRFQHQWDSWDTQTVTWLQDENRPKALKVLGDLYLGADSSAEQKALAELKRRPNYTEVYKRCRAEYPDLPAAFCRPKAKSASKNLGWGDLYPEELAPYAAQDAFLTAELARFQGIERGYNRTLAREMAAQDLYYRMRQRGVLLNPDGLRGAGAEYAAAADAIQSEYPEHDLAKIADVKRLLYDDLGLPVRETTPKGVPSTGKNALEQLPPHRAVEDVLEFRRMRKAIDAYVEPLGRYHDSSIDGRIHPEFNPVGTTSGRRSSSLPNLQQIPKYSTLPGVRESFTAGPGLEMWEYDLMSAELFVGASITEDPVLTSILMEGRNLHEETAERFFGTRDHSSRFYTLAKNINYGIPYGAGVRQIARFAAKAGLDPDEAMAAAEQAVAEHHKMFETYHAASRRLAKQAEREGRLQHIGHPGRYRHFNSPFTRVPSYTALNSLVQGGVGETVKDVALELERRIPGVLRLEIHDSLVVEGDPGIGEEVQHELDKIIVEVNPFSLPLTFEGKQWRSA